MGAMPVADVARYLDAIGTAYIRAIGTQGTGYGLGKAGETWGMYRGFDLAEDVLRDVAALDLQPAADLAPVLLGSMADLDGRRQAMNLLDPLLSGLHDHLLKNQILPGVSNLETYLIYFNTGAGGPWTCLASPLTKDLLELWASYTFSHLCYYSDLPVSGTNPNGLGSKVVAGAFTAGPTIDQTLYAGAFPRIAGTGIVGAGTATVTGSARKPDGTVQSPATWTAALTAGAPDLALAPGGGTPPPADSLILSVTGITLAAGVTAGTARVYGAPPSGRSALPL